MSQEVQTEERVETEAVAQETAKTEKSGRKSVDILMVALNSISAVLLFIITGIPVLLLALAKFFEDFHNPFYVSERRGLNGKNFRYFKIRTMCIHADELDKQLINAGLNESDPPKFRMENDPRITWLGERYRHYRLDRLPALMNVIAGQLSLADVFRKRK